MSKPIELSKSRVIYNFVRGSKAHGLFVEGKSDIDTMRVFVAPLEQVIGLRGDYVEQMADEKNDNVCYEVGRFLELLEKSNPTMLESLFVDDDCKLEVAPVMQKIIDNRDKFISKDTLRTNMNYAANQIKKARGYKKLCAYPEDMERKTPIDFCYTFNGYQGTEPITDWLNARGLIQKYCGLNHVSNMNMMHCLFYDWGEHIHLEYETPEKFAKVLKIYCERKGDDWKDKMEQIHPGSSLFVESFHKLAAKDDILLSAEEIWHKYIPKGYRGITHDDGSSTDIRKCSIKKNDYPLCYLSYNIDGYKSHCVLYKEWSSWKKKRNVVRYESNYGTGYDAKNVEECIRILTMTLELAEGKGFNVNREKAGDREYLLDIKEHKYEYEELLAKCNELKSKIEAAIEASDLPEHTDHEFVSNLLIEIRKEYYNM